MRNQFDTSGMKETFLSAKPFPHIIIDGFLDTESLLNLTEALKEEDFYLKMSDLFTMYQTNDLVSSENPIMQSLYTYFKSEKFVEFCTEITGIEFTPDKLDLQGSIYQDTNFLLCHDDQLEGRKLAFLIYLTDMSKDEGGALTLFDNDNGAPNEVKAKILPKINRFVCFEVNDVSFHEVEEVLVDKQRLALGGWLH